MMIAAEYWAGCSMATIAAHQPPADSPIEAQAVRVVWTRKVAATQFGTSWDSQVSTWARPGPPFTHSVSTPAGISICGETINAGRIRLAVTVSAITVPKAMVSIHSLGVPGYP